MELSTIILIIICVLVLALIATLLGVIFYSGLLATIQVSAGKPQIKRVTIAYKFGTGSYKNTGAIFTEITSIAPTNKSVGIYYDDPDSVCII